MIALRRSPRLLRVTLVPLIDVLFILLAYFMVTSVYLDLDMIPMSSADDGSAAVEDAGAAQATVLLRITSDNRYSLRGAATSLAEFEGALQAMVAERPGLAVVILPSPRADLQALAAAMDALSRVGVTQSQVMRLEEQP